MTTSAVSAIGLLALIGILWGQECSVAGVVPDAPPKAVSATHPVAHLTPATLPGGGPYSQAPVSLTFQTAGGDTLYSRRVNQITCRVLKGNREWLGTHLGVKVLDFNTNKARHYTRRDGLPGDYVEDIVVDATGVFCIVRVGTGAQRIALCTLDIPSGKWKTIQEAKPLMVANNSNNNGENTEWLRFRGRSRLAMNVRLVLFAPATVGRESDTVLYVFDRATKKVRPIAWDANLRADNPVLATSFVALDNTFGYLGTNLGLCVVDLSPRTGPGSAVWQRHLPTRFVDAGVLTPDGKTLWLSVHDRIRPTMSDSRVKQDLWSLVALDTRSQAITTVPTGGRMPPDNIVWDPAGELWFLHRESPNSRVFISRSDSLDVTRFDCYTPTTKRWTHWTLTGVEINPNAPPSNRTNPYTPNVPIRPASLATVPDTAVFELAFDRVTGDEAVQSNENGYRENSTSLLNRPDTWVRARFPRWYCAEDHVPAPTSYVAPDPAKPGWSWSGNERTLIHQPESGKNVADVVRYEFPVGPLTVRARVGSVVARGDTVIVQTNAGLFELGDTTDEWKTAYRPKRSSTFDALNNPMTRVGPNNTILLNSRAANEPLRYFDPATSQFVESGIPVPPDTQLLGGSPSGVWFRGFRGDEVYFVPVGANAQPAGAVEKIDATLPADLAPPTGNRYLRAVGATGDILWYIATLRRRVAEGVPNPNSQISGIIGYDRDRKRWTAPLEHRPSGSNEFVPFLGADGAVYIPLDGTDAAVHRYDGKTNRWERVAAPLPTMEQLDDKRSRGTLTLLAAGGREIYLTDWKYLYRHDKDRDRWTYEELPAPLQEYSGPSTVASRVAVTKNAYWLGSEQGLWRFDLAKRVWQERKFTLNLTATPDATSSADDRVAPTLNLYPRAVDSHSVWGTAAPSHGAESTLFRFDRVTHDFTLYDSSSGMPMKDIHSLMSDGDGLWAVTSNGTYRLDPKTGKGSLQFRSDYYNISPKNEQYRKSVPFGTVFRVQEDMSDPETAYILLSSAGGTVFPTDPQPPILYRWHKRDGRREPMPISPSLLASLAERNADGSYATRAPSISGSGGLLIEPGKELWVGTTAGVFRVDRKTNTWRLADMPPGTPRFSAQTISPAPTGGIQIQGVSDMLQVTTSP